MSIESQSSTILIVDDEEPLRYLLSFSLQREGYECLTAETGEEALQIAKRIQPNLIITDYKMPGMDGMQVLQRLKANKDTKNIPVIMLTAYGSSKEAAMFMKLGGKDYLDKPFKFESLISAVTSILERNPNDSSKQESQEKRTKKISSTSTSHKLKKTVIDLSEFGKMTRTIVHDIKNNNLTINQLAQELLERLHSVSYENDELVDLTKEIIKKSKMIFQDIGKLRNLTIPGVPSFRQLDINRILQEVINLTSTRLISVKIDLDQKVPNVIGDEELLMQLFNNLVQNSIQAMPEGGELTLQTDTEGEFVKILIRDTGNGIPKKNWKKIFDLHFTTKREGYGIGLYLAKNIVASHKGKIILDSKVNKGTTFTVYLPIAGEDKNND